MLPKTYIATEHDINEDLIDQDALTVIRKLREAGFEAYLVGGSVRDLLKNKKPKDYDISTSALPEEIKKVFERQCLLIGRRFRLAHIRFGHKIFEVATFRSGENTSDLITRDNEWGNAEEDALRRDFTINGLFYSPSDHSVIDYVGGWDDIHEGTLRSIGDPHVRFKQDPVRMIRLLKFRARFGFHIADDCKHALLQCKSEITKSSPARVLEEMFRMLESGASRNFFRLMTDSGIMELLLPSLASFLKGKDGKDVYHYLAQADNLNNNSTYRCLDRAVMTSCLLFPILEKRLETEFLNKDLTPHVGDIILLTSSIIKEFMTSSFSHFPKRISAMIGYILSTQYRLTPFTAKRHAKPKFVFHKEFPLAMQFFKIRSLVDPKHAEMYASWRQTYKEMTHRDREHHNPPPKNNRPRRYERKTHS